MLILIRYDSCKVPGKLLGKTFLDWTNDDVRPHFWKRLVESVGEPGNYRNPWNQSSWVQDGGQSEKQNDGQRVEQNCGQSEGQNAKKSENQNEDVKKDSIKTERKSSNSKSFERSVSYTKDDSENAETSINFVEGEPKLIDTDGNISSIDSDTGRLLENENDIIDIHASVIKI